LIPSESAVGSIRTALRLLAVLAMPLCGCGRVAAPPPAEPVTISFAHPASATDFYRGLVQDFNEAYPHITVELVIEDASDQPDVFASSPFQLDDLLEEGAILSLDPFMEQDASFDLSDFYPGTVALFTQDGDTWAIPADMSMRVMFYNRDLFDAAGVDYPELEWTLDDFLNKALAVSDPDAGVFGYVPIDDFIDPLVFIYQHGGRVLDDWDDPTRTTFDDPLTIEALEWYGDLVHVHKVMPTPDQVYLAPFEGSMEGGVYRGKVAMWTSWLAERGGGDGLDATWPAEWNMQWGVVPLPRGAQLAAPAFARGYYISSQAASPQACWQWVSFLSQRLPPGMMPARKSLAESRAYEQLVGDDVAAVARASVDGALMFSPRLFQAGGWFFPFNSAVDAVAEGRSTAGEALTRAQQQTE
jgi:ABC-type glycerol-3-phosphate transport system substrate-binding protein